MPNQKKRARRRKGGAGVVLPVLIVIVAMTAAALTIVLIHSNPLAPERNGELPYDYGNLNFVESEKSTAVPLVLGATSAPKPEGEEPMETPVPASPSEEENQSTGTIDATDVGTTVTENRFIPATISGDYFLPVFDKALRTPDDRAMIAITVDGCDDPNVMTQILNLAAFYGAELTLFPSGDALMAMPGSFRTCVNSLNYELENCAYDANRRDYTMSTGELALQIWRQSIATSYAVSRDYQQHFYRPRTQQSVYDQRTHFFIRKLGFLGIAGYTHSYRDHDIDSLVDSLENGNIYQFDMSEKSMEMLDVFMNAASDKGYKLVTMNELFDLNQNEIGRSLTIGEQTLPEMNDYTPTYYDLKLNYRTNAVYSLQARLISLGYLSPPSGESEVRADGIYGADTSVAVSKFQARVGLVATGNADVETQQKLFAEDAPPAYG